MFRSRKAKNCKEKNVAALKASSTPLEHSQPKPFVQPAKLKGEGVLLKCEGVLPAKPRAGIKSRVFRMMPKALGSTIRLGKRHNKNKKEEEEEQEEISTADDTEATSTVAESHAVESKSSVNSSISPAAGHTGT